MIPTRYDNLCYCYREKTGEWQLFDTDKQCKIGPTYTLRADLVANLSQIAEEYGATGRSSPLHPYTAADYYDATCGVGPLAPYWKDKPHRLLWDLCDALEQVKTFA